MLEAIFTSKARIRILQALLLDAGGCFYLRELVVKTGLPQGSVQRELGNLVKAGILTRDVSGRQTYYRANESCPIAPELRSMLIKTVGVVDVIKAALTPKADKIKAAFIFGSFARGDVRPESDIDLFVVGAVSPRELASLLKSAHLSHPVNPVVMTESEFAERIADEDHFLWSIMDAPRVFILGDKNELG